MDNVIFYKPPAPAAVQSSKITHASTSDNGTTLATSSILKDIDEVLRNLVPAEAIGVAPSGREKQTLDPYWPSEDGGFRLQDISMGGLDGIETIDLSSNDDFLSSPKGEGKSSHAESISESTSKASQMHSPKRGIIKHRTGDSQDKPIPLEGHDDTESEAGLSCFVVDDRGISSPWECLKSTAKCDISVNAGASPSTSHRRASETDEVMAVANRKDNDQDKSDVIDNDAGDDDVGDDDVGDDDNDYDDGHQRTERQGLRPRVSYYSSGAQQDGVKSTSPQIRYNHDVITLNEGCESNEDNGNNTDDDNGSDSYSYSNDDGYGDGYGDGDGDDYSGIDEGSQFLERPEVSPFDSDTPPERSLSDRCSKQPYAALPKGRKRRFSDSSHCYPSTSMVGSDIDTECKEFPASLKVKTVGSEMFLTFSFHQEHLPLYLPGNSQSQQMEVAINGAVKAPDQVPMSEAALLRQSKRLRFTRKEDVLLMNLKEDRGFRWKDIKPHFPNRSMQTLQVHYSTKLKKRTSMSRKGRKSGSCF